MPASNQVPACDPLINYGDRSFPWVSRNNRPVAEPTVEQLRARLMGKVVKNGEGVTGVVVDVIDAPNLDDTKLKLATTNRRSHAIYWADYAWTIWGSAYDLA